MRKEELWRASKYVRTDGRLHASRDPSFVSVASRLNVDLLAASLNRVLTSSATGRLLDLGCGAVPLYEVYKDLVNSIYCVDWSNSGHGLEHIDVATDLNASLPLDSASFDTVLLTDVLEHIAEPDSLLSEIARVLAPSGVLIGTVPFMYRLHEEPHDYFRFTAHALRRYAIRHHLSVELLEPYGVGTDVLFDLLGKILLASHWRLGPLLASACHRFGLRLRSSRLGLLLNKSASTIPLGYIFVFRSSKK